MHLFVYGTLLSTIPSSMAKFLRRRATLVGAATVQGQLYNLGMYPGFTTKGSATVTGEVYALDVKRAEETLAMLDAYEGVTGEREDEYHRGTVTCTLQNDRKIEAQTYISSSVPGGAATIAGGDYAEFYQRNAEHQRFVNGG